MHLTSSEILDQRPNKKSYENISLTIFTAFETHERIKKVFSHHRQAVAAAICLL